MVYIYGSSIERDEEVMLIHFVRPDYPSIGHIRTLCELVAVDPKECDVQRSSDDLLSLCYL